MFLILCRTKSKSVPELSPLAPSGPGYSSNMQNVDNLKLCSMIGQGKYGTVWKGIVNEQAIAVKIFPSQHKQYFLNEKDIYSIPLFESPSLLAYFGCDQRCTMDDNVEYLMVLSLAPLGCLQDWLINNIASFHVFCKMSKSVSRGLSHMHTQIIKGDIIKPCVCHRDLNSRNVLVKADLSCCICDFGFAVKTFGPRYEYKGEMTLAETKSINEVGTLRYMAPEILEGAVNLRDCEAALKQIDVYALGLIIWELCTRCEDFYLTPQTVPPYKTPYEAEIGKNPSFEQMQVLVSRHKARPQFPSTLTGCQAVKIAKDTCEDCWDHDAEARLTALCVEERLHELSTYKPNSSDASSDLLISSSLKVNSSSVIDHNLYAYSNNSTNIIIPNSISRNSMTTDTILSLSEDLGGLEASMKQSTAMKTENHKGWNGIRALIQKNLLNSSEILSIEQEDTSNLVESTPAVKTITNTHIRPSNLDIKYSYDNLHSDNNHDNSHLIINIVESENQKYKRLPGDFTNQTFTVINPSPKKMYNQSPKIVISKSANAVKNLNNIDAINEKQIKRQRSLEVFREVFNSKGSSERLRDPSQRVKTPGDVPPSVRKIRASKTLSLYDDRMMDSSLIGNTL